jgi:hypothetical protein
MYVGQMYAYSTGLAAYKDAGNGPYTHYVDPQSPNCTNTSNNYGSAAVPRCTMPATVFITAGAVVEVHGTVSGSIPAMIYNGTAAAPIFVRGANASTKGAFSTVGVRVRGHYLIYENLEFITGGLDIRPNDVTEAVHHIAVRHSYIHAGANVYLTGLAGSLVTQVVVYDNQIYTDNFDPNGGEFVEHDKHGVSFDAFAEDVWIVDNDIRGQSGDAVGNGHGANWTIKRFYIGRNLLHGTGENGVDLKEVDGVVVSQNKMYHFTGLSSGDDGLAVVVHYGPNDSAKNVWVIFNDISDAVSVGIQVGGSQVFETYFIGNIVHDVHNANRTGKAFETWGSCKTNVVGNIFVNNDNGVKASGTGACGKLVLKNNIIANIPNAGGFSIDRLGNSGYAVAAEISHNLLYPAGPSLGVNCTDCLIADPLFVSPSLGDFRLQAGSLGIDAGDTHAFEVLAATFSGFFGLDIHKDADGRHRPMGLADDIGAFEFAGGTVPRPPTGLRIK